MKEQWAQAQKDATHISNFLRSLVRVQEVFAQVAEAEVELARLTKAISVAQQRKQQALHKAKDAEADSQHRVTVAEEAAEAGEQSLTVTHSEVVAKREALEQEAAQDRLGFAEFKANLAGEKEDAEGEHKVRMDRMTAAEEASRKVLEIINRRRKQMIEDLQPEAGVTTDVSLQ